MFRLAKDLHKTVHELETQMPASELTYWIAYYTILYEEDQRERLKQAALAGLRRK